MIPFISLSFHSTYKWLSNRQEFWLLQVEAVQYNQTEAILKDKAALSAVSSVSVSDSLL